MAPSVVLVTGVAGQLGGGLAARLAADPSIDRVLGVDTTPPSRDMRRRMGRAEFVRVDIRNPLIGKVISTAKVDTVVHASLSGHPSASGGRSMMMEMNVIGTMQLLAACQKSDTVGRLVVRSTTSVYGASPRDPAMFTEATEPKALPPGGYAKDAVEIEGYVRSFSRRRPDIPVTTLRFVNLIGPRADTAFAHYFSLPVVPVVLGYDARVQLLHTEDALAVLERATMQERPGVFNVGADGVLMLSQAVRRAGRVALPIPEPLVPWVGRITRRAGARRQNIDRFLDRVDGALGGARAEGDQVAGAVEIEPADLADAGRDQEVRRIAGEPRAGDAVLHDVEGIDHYRGDAGASAAAEKFALDGTLGRKQPAKAAALRRLGLDDGDRGFGRRAM